MRNSLERAWPTMAVTTSSPTSSASQLPATAQPGGGALGPVPAGGRTAAVGGAGGADSAGTAGAPSPEGGVDPQADQAVEGDREQQQRADGGLLPERLDPQDDQRRGDRPQQQRAERGAVDAARAAEDGHAADHGGGDRPSSS